MGGPGAAGLLADSGRAAGRGVGGTQAGELGREQAGAPGSEEAGAPKEEQAGGQKPAAGAPAAEEEEDAAPAVAVQVLK